MANLFGFGENEPILKSAEENGDRLGTFAIKIKNLFSDLYDTLNSFSWTAATTSADGFMSAEDKTALDAVPSTYLPLTGGTLTGNLSLSQVLSFTSSSPVVNAGGADHYLRLGNGDASTLYGNGASLYLYGAATTGETQGGFNLQTYDGSNRVTLSGRPNGTLTWNNKNLAVVDEVDATTSGYIRLTNGIQMVWGAATVASGNESTGVAVTFEKAFSSAPRIFTNVLFSSAYGYGFSVQAISRTATGCTLVIGTSNGGTAAKYANGNVIYFAIGPWA